MASGKVVKGGGGPKSFEEKPSAPKGRNFQIIKKHQKTDHDDDFDEEDGEDGKNVALEPSVVNHHQKDGWMTTLLYAQYTQL